MYVDELRIGNELSTAGAFYKKKYDQSLYFMKIIYFMQIIKEVTICRPPTLLINKDVPPAMRIMNNIIFMKPT